MPWISWRSSFLSEPISDNVEGELLASLCRRLFYCRKKPSVLKMEKIKERLVAKKEISRVFSVRARHLIFLLALLAGFLLPCRAGQAEQGVGECPKPRIKSILPFAGRPGELVIIRGERFGLSHGEVYFVNKNKLEGFFLGDEAKAEILYWTFHHIWVLVPKSAPPFSEIFISVSCGAESNRVDFTVKKK